MNGLKAKDHYLLANVKLQLDDRYIVRPLPNGLTVQEAIADYLRMLNEHIVWDIQRTCSVAGKHTHEDYQYWLTVPGHWSDRAKQTMRQAAIEAGLVQPTDPPHRLMLASDEMAMAVYSARKACQLDLRDGDRFMIRHAPEGESVTLVVYEVGKTAGRACEMKEVASSFSPLCGPDFLDANMERLLERRLRKYRDIIPARGWQNFMYYFNHTIRKQFDGAEDQHLQLPTLKGLNTDDEEAGINGGYMVLTAVELREDVFESVVTDVLDLIRDVLLRSGGDCMRALFVLGEFGSTRYMWKRMREEFEHQVGMIYSPLSPELAIASGAVCLGLGLYSQEEIS
ncbi:hypothetical protein BGZ97_002576 [Linnemannia gamsii]|jgi:hypothetical protein|uniref:Uncharacterized protein n=1 Tax=Linnemannia gamsii TaxID=64522 RepID=A0A9P6UIA1_9FUNG|nr:hypothetical protein BGZ97_002576 [Linnemannia gamsii]